MKLPRYSIAALMVLALACALGFAAARLWPRPRPWVSQSIKRLPPLAPTRPQPETSYELVGTVKSVEPEEGRVVIRHEEIPGYMDAMTMPFRVKDREELAKIAPGDAVRGTLVVSADDALLTGLEVILRASKPAGEPEAPQTAPPLKVLEPGEPVPDFAMTTQDGEPLRLSDLKGEAVVLTFIFTRCPIPTACPLMDRKFADLADRIRALPGWSDSVRLVSLSFDPERDTPEVLARHAALRGAKPPLWRFAVATHEELNKVAPALGVGYGPGQDGGLVHTLGTAVIAPDGTLARLDRTSRWTPEDMVKALKPLVGPAGVSRRASEAK